MLKERIGNILVGSKPKNSKWIVAAGVIFTAMMVLVGVNIIAENHDSVLASAHKAGNTYESNESGYENGQFVQDKSVLEDVNEICEVIAPSAHSQDRVQMQFAEGLDVQGFLPTILSTTNANSLGLVDRLYQREALGLLTHSESLEELHALVFYEPRFQELTFGTVDRILIDSRTSSVSIRSGDVTEITIRFSEWLEGQYIPVLSSFFDSVARQDAYVLMFVSSVPLLMCESANPLSEGNLRSFNITTPYSRYAHGWLCSLLNERGITENTAIELILPVGVEPMIVVDTLRDIEVGDVALHSASAGTSEGSVVFRGTRATVLSVETQTGNVSLNGTQTTGLSVSTQTGLISLNGTQTTGLSISTHSSPIYLGGIHTTGLSVSTQTGPVLLHGIRTTGLSVSARDASVDLIDTHTIGLSITTTGGSVRLTDMHTTGIDIGTSSGEVALSGTTFIGLTVNTVSGDVSLDLTRNVSNYSIIVMEGQGTATLGGVPLLPGELELRNNDVISRISTSTGNISITDPAGSTGSGGRQ